MPRYAAFHLGVDCFKSTNLGVTNIQMSDLINAFYFNARQYYCAFFADVKFIS